MSSKSLNDSAEPTSPTFSEGFIALRLTLNREDYGDGDHGTFITDVTHLAHQLPEGTTATDLEGIRYSIWEDFRSLLGDIDKVLASLPTPKDSNA